MEMISTPSSRRFPVTVTQLPVTRCQIGDHTMAYRPGTISDVLTEHYRRAHPRNARPPLALTGRGDLPSRTRAAGLPARTTWPQGRAAQASSDRAAIAGEEPPGGRRLQVKTLCRPVRQLPHGARPVRPSGSGLAGPRPRRQPVRGRPPANPRTASKVAKNVMEVNTTSRPSS